jgi:hypothetical protein
MPGAPYMQYKLVYGTHQTLHLMPFSVDRTNLFTGRVELHVMGEPFNAPNATYMSLSYGAQIAGQSGITSMASGGTTPPKCVGVERRYDEANSMAIYTYTYEGIATSHSQKWIEFELEFTMIQEPIETHPSFKDLNDKFGPYDALNRLWPQYITQQTATAGLSGQQQGGPVLNPMFGVASFFNPGLTYRISYTDIDVDPGLFNNIGAIVTPPGLGQLFDTLQTWIQFPGTRNWLKMAPKVRQHGSCI